MEQKQAIDNDWVLYHIGLFDANDNIKKNKANKPETYIGISNQLCHRLQQHNQLIKGGARSTCMRGGQCVREGEAVWKPICFIPNLTKKYAMQLERSVKSKYKKHRATMLHINVRKHINQLTTTGGDTILTSTKGIFESLHMERVVPKAPLTRDIKPTITINWCRSEFCSSRLDALPAYIEQKILTQAEQQQLFTLTSKSKQWCLKPW